jgi:hypothetical protein
MDDEDATARRANRLTRLAELAKLASQSDAGQPQVQARLLAPNAESGVVDVAGQSPDARLEPTPLDPFAAQADRLEKALAELEARKKAAAEMAAKSAPHLERWTALQAQLQALPQNERRGVLDAIGLHKVSAVPQPITRLRGGGFVGRPAPQRQPARWALWLTIPRVELWQAVLLSLGIEPDDSLEAEACGRVPDEPLSFNRLSREFFSRREDCLRALSTEGPIRPQGSLYVGMLQSPRCPVLLAEVAAFLARIGATVPIEMQATPAVTKTEEPNQSDSAEMQPLQRRQAQDRALLGAESPAVPTAQAEPAKNPEPPPLTTSDIASAFAGLRWSEAEWKKPLGDKPKWLAACVSVPGSQGSIQTRWNPVCIGGALIFNGHVQARSVRARFQTNHLLRHWLDAWKTYEADNLDTP